ncbi:hypothetical protein PQ478_08670 [Alkalihalophilus pseudofirmus]|uniref:hypothetical protein n=1 Tax=Alkalihalophilus pseudofirmus TaxID=79885 RepID=UPI00259B803F|nr:hypothetical protein [Alkalihalophilus pseudofirmus]WEG18542.1 hypothetical protein PQ478_08670 [Alkalihalophilus pseudofirmus]
MKNITSIFSYFNKEYGANMIIGQKEFEGLELEEVKIESNKILESLKLIKSERVNYILQVEIDGQKRILCDGIA